MSLISINDRALHSSRRRIISKVFCERELKNIENVIVENGLKKLIKVIRSKGELDISERLL